MTRFSAWLGGISPKLYAAVAGAGGGAAVKTYVLWQLGVAVWGAPVDADHWKAAVDAVPSPVAGGVSVLLVGLGVIVGAYIAPGQAPEPYEARHAAHDDLGYVDPDEFERPAVDAAGDPPEDPTLADLDVSA